MDTTVPESEEVTQEAWERFLAKRAQLLESDPAPPRTGHGFQPIGSPISRVLNSLSVEASTQERQPTSSPITGTPNQEPPAESSIGALPGVTGAEKPSAINPVVLEAERAKRRQNAVAVRDDKRPLPPCSTPSGATRKEIAEVLERLIAVFGRPVEWAVAAPVYFDVLSDLTSQELAVSLGMLAHNHTGFMPKPAEILRAAGKYLDDATRGWSMTCAGCGCTLAEENRQRGRCRYCF